MSQRGDFKSWVESQVFPAFHNLCCARAQEASLAQCREAQARSPTPAAAEFQNRDDKFQQMAAAIDAAMVSVGQMDHAHHDLQVELAARFGQVEALQREVGRLTGRVWAAEAAASQANLVAQVSESRSLCLVCQEKERTCLYLPCKHLAVCSECDAAIAARGDGKIAHECPACQGDIANRVTGVFLP